MVVASDGKGGAGPSLERGHVLKERQYMYSAPDKKG